MANEEKELKTYMNVLGWDKEFSDAANVAIKALENRESMQRELKSLDGIAT